MNDGDVAAVKDDDDSLRISRLHVLVNVVNIYKLKGKGRCSVDLSGLGFHFLSWPSSRNQGLSASLNQCCLESPS